MSNFGKMSGVRVLLSGNRMVLSRSVEINYIRGYSSISSGNSKDNKCSSYQPIADFYSGKSVFITGGTGFLGKVFLEKLLYSCTKLDKVYLLVREKKGETVQKRVEDMFAAPIFKRLKQSNPDFKKKVVPVAGDVVLPNLGLNPKDEQTLIDNVSVVYHAAANVKFNEPLPVAMNINFEGTKKILKLSRQMKNLEVFVYISTAYAHTQRNVLVETIYPPPAKVEDVYKFMEEHGHDVEETMKFINEKPSTYTFSKALTEAYIASNRGDMPTVIIRPSIVSPSKDEPIKCWIDNWYGPTPLLFNVAKGWNRFVRGNSDSYIDFIPVDYVSNMSIVAAARAKNSSEIQVYNCTSTAENPIKWFDAHRYFNEEFLSRGKNEMPYPFVLFTKSKALIDIATFVFQTTPAHIADWWLRVTGREPKYAKLLSQVVNYREALTYFTNNHWMMRSERARELYSSLSKEDKERFPCDPTQIEWSEYMRDYAKGTLKYLKPRYTAKS